MTSKTLSHSSNQIRLISRTMSSKKRRTNEAAKREKPDVDWGKSAARVTMMRDLESWILSVDEEEVSAESAWDFYKNLEEFHDIMASFHGCSFGVVTASLVRHVDRQRIQWKITFQTCFLKISAKNYFAFRNIVWFFQAPSPPQWNGKSATASCASLKMISNGILKQSRGSWCQDKHHITTDKCSTVPDDDNIIWT